MCYQVNYNHLFVVYLSVISQPERNGAIENNSVSLRVIMSQVGDTNHRCEITASVKYKQYMRLWVGFIWLSSVSTSKLHILQEVSPLITQLLALEGTVSITFACYC